MSVQKNVINRLAKLPRELIIIDFIPHLHYDEIVVEIPRPETVPCPYCTSEHCNIKDQGRKRSIRHLAFGSRGTAITFKQRRYICKDCNHSFQEPVYWIMDNIRITGALYLEICIDTFHVVKLISDNVTDVRCSLQRWYRDGGDNDKYQLLKNSARILTTAKSNQPDYWKGKRAIKNQKKLNECLALSDELRES